MKTVLIVENEKVIRQGIRAMMQRCGVPIEMIMECGNGEMALEILQSQKVDVMFTEICLPKMTGIELVQKIKDLPDKPFVVAISGYADFFYAVEMLRMGAKDFFLKPLEYQKICDIMERLEQEVSQTRENSRTSKRLGHQQLKYLMLNEKITEEELNTMQSEYESEFALHAYYVYALSHRESKKPAEEQYIYLHNVEGYDVYLVSDKNAGLLSKNELAQEYVGVSLQHSGIRELRTAYQEAVAARQQAFCTNRRIWSAAEQKKKIPETLYGQGQKLIGEEARMQRVQLLGTDKAEELVRAWNGLFYAVRNEWITPTDFIRCMEEFWKEIRKIYRNVVTDEEENMKRLSDYYSFPTLAVWQTEFIEWLLGLQESINSQYDGSRNQQKIKRAIEYIRKNYDKDLNMAVVSNYISMNYSLFSCLFKEYTGSNFVYFLKNIRMEEAKKLLTETELRIVEISVKVGYENEKHFMKTFKAACGVSPSEYRKNVQMQNSPLRDKSGG